MLDLQTGKCQFILASLAGYDPKEGLANGLAQSTQPLRNNTLVPKMWKSSKLKAPLNWLR